MGAPGSSLIRSKSPLLKSVFKIYDSKLQFQSNFESTIDRPLVWIQSTPKPFFAKRHLVANHFLPAQECKDEKLTTSHEDKVVDAVNNVLWISFDNAMAISELHFLSMVKIYSQITWKPAVKQLLLKTIGDYTLEPMTGRVIRMHPATAVLPVAEGQVCLENLGGQDYQNTL